MVFHNGYNYDVVYSIISLDSNSKIILQIFSKEVLNKIKKGMKLNFCNNFLISSSDTIRFIVN